jgi:hypothetical protein
MSRRKYLSEKEHKEVADKIKDSKAKKFWMTNKDILVGLEKNDIIDDVDSRSINKECLVGIYSDLVTLMSPKEQVEFLQQGLEQLKVSNNKKFKELVFITELLKQTPKIAMAIAMAL